MIGEIKMWDVKVLQSHIQYILDIASLHHVDTLILGAFGYAYRKL